MKKLINAVIAIVLEGIAQLEGKSEKVVEALLP
jgi:hypothetical protein